MSESARPSRATILVVDDDPAVRRALTRMLQSEGFETLEAADGTEAIERVAQYGGAIKAATLDLLMPTTPGSDALSTLARFAPDLAIVICTALPPPHDQLIPPPGTRGIGYVQKPVSSRDLAAEVRRVIAEVEAPD
jgi:two-component system response regulator MprA